jgi:hypothetical protein
VGWAEGTAEGTAQGTAEGTAQGIPQGTAQGIPEGPSRVGALDSSRDSLIQRAIRRARDAGADVELIADSAESVLENADILVAVTWPPADELTMALAGMAAGRVVVVLETESTAGWPALDPQTWQPRGWTGQPPIVVSIDPRDEEHSLALALRRLAADAQLRTSLGSAAHKWWQQHATLEHARTSLAIDPRGGGHRHPPPSAAELAASPDRGRHRTRARAARGIRRHRRFPTIESARQPCRTERHALATRNRSLLCAHVPPTSACAGPQQPTFRVQVEAIEIDASVTDASGNVVIDLTRDDFEILEDGRPQTITSFGLVNIPRVRAGRPLFAANAIEPDVQSNNQGEGGCT